MMPEYECNSFALTTSFVGLYHKDDNTKTTKTLLSSSSVLRTKVYNPLEIMT
jgi:hypothetical protein